MILKAVDFRFFIGCPCHITSTDQPILATIEGIDGTMNMVISNRMNRVPQIIKPILRKFENLSRHEVEGLNKLWPVENIKRTTFDSIKLDADIINYLSSLHVDVFGWIEKGLAIDAEYNTLTSK
jgi:small nuclear ribonucleoprotein (snRNP)-like protein